uniref:Reverse transcriptase n=1 Tax=Anopheles gambiae TaxID=7165 RepID=Q868R4_ANOGA|nr:reverse transcriptase [Anopheles gambiae]
MEVLQINVNRSRSAQDLALNTMRVERADVCLMVELHSVPRNNGNWVADRDGKVAIIASSETYPVQQVVSVTQSGIAAARINDVLFICCYVSPSAGVSEFEEVMQRIDVLARGHPRVVFAGDLNAWHTAWGSCRTNAKGEAVVQLVDSLGLEVLNTGTAPTFLGNGVARPSVVDVAFASSSIAGVNTIPEHRWRIISIYSYSNHVYIRFAVGELLQRPAADSRRQEGPSTRESGTRWRTRHFDAELFGVALDVASFTERVTSAESLERVMTEACDAAMARVFPSQGHSGRPAYWWTPAIEVLCENCRLAKERLEAAIDEEEQIAAASDLLQVRTALDSSITTSKKEHFDEILRGLAEDETGQWYRNVLSRLSGSWTARERDSSVLEVIVSTLFPQHPPVDWPASPGQVLERGEEEPVRDVNEQELLDIASSLNPRKAPGLDGVPNAALTAAIRKHTDIFKKLFQECLDNERFPDEWKKQKLALIPKPGKPPGLASSFRPILLLNNPGKVYERLLLSRINDVIEDPESPRLAENQYGFRRGRSTVQAIQLVVDAGSHAMSFGRTNNRDKRCLLVVALDVRNAFNTASWQCIATALEDKGVPRQLRNILRDYFANRELVYDTADGPVTRRVTAGVPQGSILGPTLWNIMYDGVLRVELPEGASVIGYADDIVVMARGCTPQEAALVAEQAVDAIAAWMEDHHLQLAPEKTEGVMISSLRRGQLKVPFRVGDTIIHSKQSIRYLGVQIHDHLSWKPHVELSTAKALRVVGVVTAVMRNHSGPQVAKRRLLAAVAESIIRYAAPVWSEATDLQWCQRKLAQVQRPLARGVTSSFVSVAYETGVALAGLVPFRLLVREDARCHRRLLAAPGASRKDIRLEERQGTFQEWQRAWDAAAAAPTASRYAVWAHRMIPDLHLWMSRRHGEVDFHLSQVLTGHGYFREYLHVCGFAPSAECPRCPGSVESVAHVLFQCEVFHEIRVELLGYGTSDPVNENNLGMKLLESPERWNSIQEAARKITKVLQQLWREDELQLNLQAHLAALPTRAAAVDAGPLDGEQVSVDGVAELFRSNRGRARRTRRGRRRAEERVEVRLASAMAAAEREREDSILMAAVRAEEAGEAPPPIPMRRRGLPPSPRTVRARHERRLYLQRLYRQRAREGTLPTVPHGRNRRSRSAPSEADTIRRRMRRREMERLRRTARRVPSNQGVREVLSADALAAITEATTSGR